MGCRDSRTCWGPSELGHVPRMAQGPQHSQPHQAKPTNPTLLPAQGPQGLPWTLAKDELRSSTHGQCPCSSPRSLLELSLLELSLLPSRQILLWMGQQSPRSRMGKGPALPELQDKEEFGSPEMQGSGLGMCDSSGEGQGSGTEHRGSLG